LTFEDGVIKGPNYEQVSIGTDAVWIDNNTYAATGDNASLMIHRLTETAPVMRLRGHTQGINSLNFDSASQLLASGSDDHTVRIWHGKSQVSIMSLVGHTGPVMVVRWHQPPASLADSLDPEMKAKSLLISASTDGTVRIWHPYRGVALCILALHEGPIFFCEVSPNGKFLATGGADQVLIIWDLSGISVNSSTSGQTQQPSGDRAVFRYEPETSADGDSITSISWNLDSTRVFVGYGTKSVVLSI
jgi:transducin (beta)-like 1